MKPPDLDSVLNQFPAYQLHSTLVLTQRLKAQKGLLRGPTHLASQFSLEQLVNENLTVNQIESALEVIQSSHDAWYGKASATSLMVAVIQRPEIRENGKERILEGLSWKLLDKLDEELSKRENTRPLNKKIAIEISKKKGVYLLSDPENSYLVSKKRFDLLFFIRTHSGPSLKTIAKGLSATDQNTSRDVRIVNTQLREKLRVDFDLIKHTATGGYFLDTDKYQINWS